MKKLLLTLLVAMLALPGFARDIEYSYEDQTLTYTVIDEEAKTVRTKDGVSNTAGNEVSGNLVIPSQIKDGDETYHVVAIGEYAFYRCSGLTSITIPEAVTSIGDFAFYGCSGLNTVILPKMLETLEGGAFAECDKIRNVVYTATNPVESFSSVFVDEVYHNATLYLPSGRIEAIRSVEPWKSFRNYSDEAFCGVENVIADFNEDAPYEVFNLNGVKAAESTVNLPAGIYIVRQGNNVKKITVK